MPEMITDRAPAPFWHRAAAYLLDRLILLLPLLLLRIPALISAFRGSDLWSMAIFFDRSLLSILGWVLCAAYFTLFTGLLGATPGKRAMKLRVVTEEGKVPGLWTALYRETVGRYLSGILCIGYIMAAADPRKRALHDMICDTRVVVAEPRPAPAAPAKELRLLETDDPQRDWYKPYRV